MGNAIQPTAKRIMLCAGLWSLISCSPKQEATPNHPPEAPHQPSRPVIQAALPSARPSTQKFIEKQLEDFQFLHPTVQIKLTSRNRSATEESQRIVQMIQSGDYSQTIIAFNNAIYSKVAHALNDRNWPQKQLVNLLDYPAFVATHKPAAINHILTQKSYKDILPGPVIEAHLDCLWYHQKLADQIGLDLQPPTLTSTNLMLAAEKIRLYNRGNKHPIYLFFILPKNAKTQKLLFALYLSNLADATGALPARVEAAPAKQALQQALATLEALAPCFAIPTPSSNQAEKVFLRGQQLFFIDTTSHYSAFTEKKGKDWTDQISLFHLPSDGLFKYATGYYYSFWAIMKNAPHVQTAIDFMQYLSRPELATEWMRTTKSATGLAGSNYDPTFSHDNLGTYIQAQGHRRSSDITSMNVLLKDHWPWKHLPSNEEIRRILYNLFTREISAQTAYEQLTPARKKMP